MQVSNPERYIDDQGNPIEEMDVEGSRFDKIAIKRMDSGVEVRAHDTISETVVEVTASLTDELYKGVAADDGTPRRDVDDDIQDALNEVGYTLVNRAAAGGSSE